MASREKEEQTRSGEKKHGTIDAIESTIHKALVTSNTGSARGADTDRSSVPSVIIGAIAASNRLSFLLDDTDDDD